MSAVVKEAADEEELEDVEADVGRLSGDDLATPALRIRNLSMLRTTTSCKRATLGKTASTINQTNFLIHQNEKPAQPIQRMRKQTYL